MKKFFFLLLFSVPVTGTLLAQVGKEKTSFGRESMKGVVHVGALSKFLEEHPSKIIRRNPQKEEEEIDEYTDKPGEADPSLIRTLKRDASFRMAADGSTPAYMPASSPAADSFQAVLSGGTNIPPDTHGGVDSNYAVCAVNGVLKIQNKTTHASVSSVSLDNFWGASLLGTGGGSFDPRVYFDPYGKRWILVAVSVVDNTFTNSKILIAVSKTSNPTGTWYKFAVDVAAGGNWLDFPTVGFNKKWIAVSGNYFTAGGSSVNSAIWCFDKTTIYSGASAPYQNFTGITNFTICPAVTYDANLNSLFLLAIFNRGASSGGQLILRKITGPVGSATLSGTIANPSAGSLPSGVNRWAQGPNTDFAPQLGSTNKVQTNDDRITNVCFRNNKLWTSHTVFFPSSSPSRSSIMWWQMDTAGTPNQIGLIDGVNKFYAFPSLAVNAANDALIGYSYFTSTTYPSAGYSYRLGTDPLDSMRTPFIYRSGKKYYYQTFGGTKNRFGDYSATCVDPSNDRDLWTAQESVPSWSSTSIWDTWWAKVKLNTTPIPPNEVAQIDDAKNAGVSIVPNPNDGAFSLVFDEAIDETITVNLLNMEGRVVFTKAYNVKNNRVAIEPNELPSGNYILNTVVDGTKISRKVTVTR